MSGSSIVDKYRKKIEELFADIDSSIYVYHNLDHTRGVVTAFREIAQGCGIIDRDIELGLIAAWFHDIGYVKNPYSHEQGSIAILEEIIDKSDFTATEIDVLKDLILATKMPQTPKTILEKAICDADLLHLGTSTYLERSDTLRKELTLIYDRDINKESWRIDNYNFLKNHNFHTDYVTEKYGPTKEENLHLLRSSIKEFEKSDKEIRKLEAKIAKLNEKLVQKPSRGIETMFRTTSRNHLDLSGMADSKANIMISVNTIVISVVMTFAAGRIAEYPYLLWPIIVLVLVCLATIVLSILATRPKVNKGTFTREDIINKKTNLLFFGNFHGMELDDYQWGMNMMMNDAEYLYNSLSRDLFFLGKVLGRKYRILRAAYTTFMIGFVISILFFVFAAIVNNTNF